MGDPVLPWTRGMRPKGSNMDIAAMTKNMLDFKEAMDKANIPFILIFGTLLGAIRDKGLIPYDYDADVACYADDHLKMLSVIRELTKKGFHIPDKNEIPLHDHFFIRDSERLDVWWFDKIDEDWVYDNRVRYASHFFDEPQFIDFLGTKFLAPHNPLDFLDITYGPDWKTPYHINDPRSDYILDCTMPNRRKENIK